MTDEPTPEPEAPQAVRLPKAYDTCLIGASIETRGPDKFAYSLRKLTLFTMKEHNVGADEARMLVAKHFVLPLADSVAFINDELVTPIKEDTPKILRPNHFKKRG